MNSRKKRFWRLWLKRYKEIARVSAEEANRIKHLKFLGKPLPDSIQCSDYKE